MSDKDYLIKGDMYQYNLGWLIQELMSFKQDLATAIDLKTIKYADPIQWDITTQYSANTVVVDPKSGTAYMSKVPVPAGVELTNSSYWVVVFNYQDIYNRIMDGVAFNDRDQDYATKDLLVNDLVWYAGDLYRVTRAIPAGSKYIPETNLIKTSIESLLARYYGRDRTAQVSNDTVNVSGDYTLVAGDIAETSTNRTVKVTKDREIDVDGADSLHIDGVSTVNVGGLRTEVYAGDKTEKVTGTTTEEFTGTHTENHTGKKIVNAAGIVLNPTEPLTYGAPESDGIFDILKMIDSNNAPYSILVKNANTPTVNVGADIVNVAAYGIDLTGATDVSDAINKIISDHPNSEILFPSGKYLIKKPIVTEQDGQNGRIGQMLTFMFPNEVIIAADFVGDYAFDICKPLSALNTRGFKGIRGVYITTRKNGMIGIHSSSNGCTFESCTVETQTGFQFDQTSGMAGDHYVHNCLTRNYETANTGYNINANDCKFERNYCLSNVNGFRLNGDSCTLLNNHIVSPGGGYGIEVVKGHYAFIYCCYLDDCTVGIKVYNDEKTKLTQIINTNFYWYQALTVQHCIETWDNITPIIDNISASFYGDIDDKSVINNLYPLSKNIIAAMESVKNVRLSNYRTESITEQMETDFAPFTNSVVHREANGTVTLYTPYGAPYLLTLNYVRDTTPYARVYTARYGTLTEIYTNDTAATPFTFTGKKSRYVNITGTVEFTAVSQIHNLSRDYIVA